MPPVDVFRRLSGGVYAVGAAHGGRSDAFTAAWLTQISFEPLLVALSINPGNATYPLIRESATFAVSVLERGHLELARRLGTRSGREEDKLAGIAWRPGRAGAPILTDAIAWLECEVRELHEVGDHRLAVARVVGGAVARADAEPLLYADTGDMDGSAALYPANF
ncbi:MAG TPA: flavin reductase family protein [Gemmatimonadales bacterium]|nr:flavin reductase family protein [Gemmatimonadales bacterium]